MVADDSSPLKIHFRIILFVLKLWLLTNFVCPLVIWLPIMVKERDFSLESMAGTGFFLIAIGLALSFPGMVLMFLVMWKFTVKKSFLVVAMAAIVTVSFLLLDLRFFKHISDLILPLIYFVVSAVLILTTKIPKK